MGFLKNKLIKEAAPKWVEDYRAGKLTPEEVGDILEKRKAKPRNLTKNPRAKVDFDDVSLFRHYGADAYDPRKFKPIENPPEPSGITKPTGGFWITPARTDEDWADWKAANIDNPPDFDWDAWWAEHDESPPPPKGGGRGFMGRLKPDARIARINNRADLERLIAKYPHNPSPDAIKRVPNLDFEALAKDYDVLQLTNEGLANGGLGGWSDPYMYGWDFPSAVVLNPDAIGDAPRVRIAPRRPAPPKLPPVKPLTSKELADYYSLSNRLRRGAGWIGRGLAPLTAAAEKYKFGPAVTGGLFLRGALSPELARRDIQRDAYDLVNRSWLPEIRGYNPLNWNGGKLTAALNTGFDSLTAAGAKTFGPTVEAYWRRRAEEAGRAPSYRERSDAMARLLKRHPEMAREWRRGMDRTWNARRLRSYAK